MSRGALLLCCAALPAYACQPHCKPGPLGHQLWSAASEARWLGLSRSKGTRHPPPGPPDMLRPLRLLCSSQDSEDEQRWSRLLVPLNSVASWVSELAPALGLGGEAAKVCLPQRCHRPFACQLRGPAGKAVAPFLSFRHTSKLPQAEPHSLE